MVASLTGTIQQASRGAPADGSAQGFPVQDRDGELAKLSDRVQAEVGMVQDRSSLMLRLSVHQHPSDGDGHVALPQPCLWFQRQPGPGCLYSRQTGCPSTRVKYAASAPLDHLVLVLCRAGQSRVQ